MIVTEKFHLPIRRLSKSTNKGSEFSSDSHEFCSKMSQWKRTLTNTNDLHHAPIVIEREDCEDSSDCIFALFSVHIVQHNHAPQNGDSLCSLRYVYIETF